MKQTVLFQIFAVSIMIAFYGCYFAKLLHQRKQSIQTDLLGKDKKGFVKFVEITLKIATYTIVLVEAISIIFNWSIAPLWLRIIGVTIAILGTVIFIISVYEMRDSWRAGVPKEKETELVTSGIYKFSRNPAFLGFDLIYIGILCMFLNILLLVITGFTALLLHLQIINVEEPFMLKSFGDEYLRYKKKVCRYIGRKK